MPGVDLGRAARRAPQGGGRCRARRGSCSLCRALSQTRPGSTKPGASSRQAELWGRAGTYAAAFRRNSATFRPTLFEALALLHAALGAAPSAKQGLLIAKAHYDRLGGHRADARQPERDLVRRLGRRHVVLLRTGAIADLLDFVK